MAFHHSKGLPFTSLRLATVYGPRMRPDALVRVFLDAALNGGEIRLEGGGAQIRPFVHVDNVVDDIAAVLAIQAAPHPEYAVAGRTFNVVTDHDSIGGLASRALAAAINLRRPGCRLMTTTARTAEVGHVSMSRGAGALASGQRVRSIELKDGIPATARAMLEGR